MNADSTSQWLSLGYGMAATRAVSRNQTNVHARTVAQERRRQENEEFRRLSALLPVPRAISEKHLDKATVVRLAGTTIRLNSAICQWKSGLRNDLLIENNVINLLEGFLLCLAPDGDILYVSETISQHLGLSQVELCGNLFWNYVHSDDLAYVRAKLAQIQCSSGGELVLNLRMRSTLTKRRSRESLSCAAGYKVISMELNNTLMTSLLAFCQPHSARISAGIPLPQNTFVLSTDDSLRILYADSQDSNSIGSGCSFYDITHPEDTFYIVEMHDQIIRIGSHISPLVRIIQNDVVFYAEVTAFRYNNPIRLVKCEKGSNRNQCRVIVVVTLIGKAESS